MSSGTDASTAPGWEVRDKPPLLFRRFEFDGYPATRAFLDALESLSKETGYYPDLGFAAKHVNVTVQARDGNALTAVDYEFATRVTALAGGP
ncbi:MAG: 4a-hydroxytetrahydrobiopterin dehydratase [Gammaproteobacteria bacterium]|nr:MAG: 4a-hydroxytetrahydrobiopterin dehydratase [Gammaproteobacteria bacterium]